ncbi:MAG: hypothetical protein GX847_07980 [Clostridiales bacterium]|nr:hypothetical protein [Clostridiales bacterium]
MKKKPDIIYITVSILCLVSMIADIELKYYFTELYMKYPIYLYPLTMTNLAGPLIVCLMIVYRQSHYQKAAVKTKILVDSSSAIVLVLYNYLLFRYRLLPAFSPESLILICLFVVPAVYNIYKLLESKSNSH